MSNLDAAQSDDRLKALRQLRDTLAEQLDLTTSSVHAQLAGQYRECLREIADIEGATEVEESPLDDIARNRAVRLAG